MIFFMLKNVLEVLLGSCLKQTEKMCSRAFSEKVTFIQPNNANISSFLVRFSQGITDRLLVLEITLTDFILAIPSSWHFI